MLMRYMQTTMRLPTEALWLRPLFTFSPSEQLGEERVLKDLLRLNFFVLLTKLSEVSRPSEKGMKVGPRPV